MSAHQQRLTDAQEHLVVALDDAAEHVMWEWDRPDPESFGTCGFARVGNIDGRCSFVQRVRSVARSKHPAVIENRRGFQMTFGALDLSLRSRSSLNGYTLSITNVAELVGGPAHQRLDVRKELHRLLLERLKTEWGYITDARVYGRVD